MNSSWSQTNNFEKANTHSSIFTECLLHIAVDFKKSFASFYAFAYAIFYWMYLLNLTALWKSIAFKSSKSISSNISCSFFFCYSDNTLNAFYYGIKQLLKKLFINLYLHSRIYLTLSWFWSFIVLYTCITAL